jgi:hypothetical protein
MYFIVILWIQILSWNRTFEQQSDHIFMLSCGILLHVMYSELSCTLINTFFWTLLILSPPAHSILDNVICLIQLKVFNYRSDVFHSNFVNPDFVLKQDFWPVLCFHINFPDLKIHNGPPNSKYPLDFTLVTST